MNIVIQNQELEKIKNSKELEKIIAALYYFY